MSEMTLDLADVKHLAATLDAFELDDKDRATLHAIFALAGQAAGGSGEEVSGFSSPSISGGLLASFQHGSTGNPSMLEDYSFTFGKITVENLSGSTSTTDDITGGSK